MARYEQILSKISPVFYKFAQYNDYFNHSQVDFVREYLKQVNIRLVMYGIASDKMNYIYVNERVYGNYFGIYEIEMTTLSVIALIAKGQKLNRYWDIYLDDIVEDIVNPIINNFINNFSFENYIFRYTTTIGMVNFSFKDLFMALVGRETYDTIRRNIK